jgi:hypothetical protein
VAFFVVSHSQVKLPKTERIKGFSMMLNFTASIKKFGAIALQPREGGLYG